MAYVLIGLIALLVIGFALIVKGPNVPYFEPKPFTPAKYPFEAEFLDVDGVKVCTVDEGKGDETLVLIHGLGGKIDNWEPTIRHFSQKMRVIAIDLPGFGLSERRNDIPYGIDYFAKTILKILDLKGVEKASIAGNSMGGHITAYMALNYPERMNHCILVDAAGLGVNFPDFLLKFAANHRETLAKMAVKWQRWFFLRDPEKARKRFEKNFRYDAKRGNKRSLVYDHKVPGSAKMLEDNKNYYMDITLTEEFPKLMHAFMNCGASIYHTSLEGKAQQIKVPTLIIWGREDGLVKIKSGYKYNDSIPGSKMTIFPQCGHVPMVEVPDQFNNAVENFITA